VIRPETHEAIEDWLTGVARGLDATEAARDVLAGLN
jgi:hypothetical protein